MQTDTVLAFGAFAPISLYLDIEKGKSADLEVVAKAALEWSAAIKELAFVLDPSLVIRVEIVSGTEGSLSLNAIIKDLRNRTAKRPVLMAVVASILSWFSLNSAEYAFNYVLDQYIAAEKNNESFTPEQIDELRNIVTTAINGNVAKDRVQNVYRHIEDDPAITGVGIATTPGARPASIVPRSEFESRSHPTAAAGQKDASRRSGVKLERVVLISPVLVEGTRRWKFRLGTVEFGATVKDSQFVASVLDGTASIPMKAGIQMMVELETIEEFKDGVWQIVERNILKVGPLVDAVTTRDLFSDSAGAEQQDNRDE